MAAQNLIDLNLVLLSLDVQRLEFLQLKVIFYFLLYRLADENGIGIIPGDHLDALAGIDGIASAVILDSGLGANVAGHDFTRMDTDPHQYVPAEAALIFLIEQRELLHHFHRTEHGALFTVRHGEGGAKSGENLVADELIHGTVVAIHDVSHYAVI